MMRRPTSRYSLCATARRSVPSALCLLAVVIVAVFAASGCSHQSQQPATAPTESVAAQTPASPTPLSAIPAATGDQAAHVQMRNVMFRFSSTAGAHIETLTGEFVPTGNNPMPAFDDKTSFAVKVKSARVSVTPAAMVAVLNDYVFAKPDAPVKDLSMTIEGNLIHVKGKLHSKGDVPFENFGTPSPTPDGRIRIHSEKVKAFKISVKGMMSLFGVDLSSVLDTSKVQGIDTDKNDLLLDLSKLLPPPHIQGAVTDIHIENNQIVVIFGTPDKSPPLEPGNYMAVKGGQLRFGKLTMTDADLMVLDLDPADPLDWFQDHYKEQLVAGYSKITPTFGLRAYIRDYSKVSRMSKTDPKPTIQ
jgi:hypothetical protein